MTRVTLRCDVSWIEREPSRGGYERNHLSMFSAICFLSYEATIYDAGHHNFEFELAMERRLRPRLQAANEAALAHLVASSLRLQRRRWGQRRGRMGQASEEAARASRGESTAAAGILAEAAVARGRERFRGTARRARPGGAAAFRAGLRAGDLQGH